MMEPDEEARAFLDLARPAFSSLLDRGFRLTSEDPLGILHYESANAFVVVVRDNQSYHLDFAIGTLEEPEDRVSMFEVMTMAGVSPVSSLQPRTAEQMEVDLAELARRLDVYGRRALEGDPVTFEGANELRRASTAKFTRSGWRELSWLTANENRGYGPLPLPVPRDEGISQWLADLKGDSDLRTSVIAYITEAHAPTLIAYAERMASLAVRQRSRQRALLGLTALALAIGVEGYDVRESLMIFPLLYDALLRVGIAPDQAFEEVAGLRLGRSPDVLSSYVARKDHSLSAMRYRAGSDNDGFRYERTW